MLPYSFPYVGTQSVEDFPPQLIAMMKDATQYADLCAGGGRIPIGYARHKPVVVNDISYYTYANLAAILTEQPELDMASFAPHLVTRLEGEVTREKKLVLPTDTAMYCDALFAMYDITITAALASVFVRHCTYRSLGWARYGGSRWVENIEPEYIYAAMCRRIERMNAVRRNREHLGHHVRWDDALKPLPDGWLIPGSVVYASAAWPWRESIAGKNPYNFFTHDVSRIMLAPEPPEFAYWERGQEYKIYSDASTWIRNALGQGAKAFVLNSQTSNWPEPQEALSNIAQVLRNECRFELVPWTNGISGLNHESFPEYFGFYYAK